MELYTDDLTLRTVTIADIAEVARMWNFEKGAISSDEASGAISGMEANHAKNKPGHLYHLCFAVFETGGDKIIGWCGLDGKELPTRPVIFYMIDADFRNKGYAAQCARRLLDYAFRNAGVNAVFGGCYKYNLPSHRVMLKAGMLQHAFDDDSGDPVFYIDRDAYMKRGRKDLYKIERLGDPEVAFGVDADVLRRYCATTTTAGTL